MRQYGRTKTTVYRVINEVRYENIMELPLDYIPNPRFSRKGADAAILGPMPESETRLSLGLAGPLGFPGLKWLALWNCPSDEVKFEFGPCQAQIGFVLRD